MEEEQDKFVNLLGKNVRIKNVINPDEISK